METIYIELEKACAALRAQEKADEECWIPAGRRFDSRRACAAISSVPYADVAPVIHASWAYNDGDYIPYCTNCMMPQDMETPYCHSCGARMEGAE